MFRRLRINTQERAISGDHNRAWALETKGISELLRRLLLVRTDETNPAFIAEPTTLTAPLSAEILRGLLVRPAVGSLNLLVDPGIVAMIDPTGIGPDDSVCVAVNSVGVPLPGSLSMTANASGSARIDVIECRLNPVPLTASDNRDIFDATSGLFTASTVTKEIEPQLQFRVRAGTPGGGFPGADNGWLPLCVAHVPNGATSNDAITFWDVRPLVEDRAQGMIAVDSRTELLQLDARWNRVSSTSWVVNGIVRARFRGRNVGGVFRRGSPGTDADTVDFGDAANRTPGITEVGGSNQQVFAYLAFPFGLPRWSRYKDASTGSRVPREPKGILILSSIAPDVDGHPSTAVPLDAVGFAGASTTDAVFAFYNGATAGTGQYREAWFQNKVASRNAGGCPSIAAVSKGGALNDEATFDVPASVVPANAKAMIVQVSMSAPIPANTGIDVRALLTAFFDGTTSNPLAAIEVNGGNSIIRNPTGVSVTEQYMSPLLRVPLSPKRPLGSVAVPHKVVWQTNISFTLAQTFLKVCGWEF